MKKSFMLTIVIVGLAATPAPAMTVDDILELCRAGFDADRIARIVEATGIEQSLEASDWSRIRTEGCGDAVVDALLNLLAPVEEVVNDSSYDASQDNLDVNLYGNWGTNGWYGSGFWGGWSPWWGVGYSSYYGSWWGWSTHWAHTSWYDPWWSHSHGRSYYCRTWNDPYYYSGGNYTGGYYSGGVYQRQKASRQGGSTKAYRYASSKASAVMTKATYASAKAKPYRGGAVATGMNANAVVGARKASRNSVTTEKEATFTRTKTTTATRGSSGVGTGSAKQEGTLKTVRTDNSFTKRATTVRNGGATSIGNSPTTNRANTKIRTSTGSTGTSTTVKRRSSGTMSTRTAPSMRAPRTGSRSAGPSYRAPSAGRSSGPSFRAPSGGGRSSGSRMSSGGGGHRKP